MHGPKHTGTYTFTCLLFWWKLRISVAMVKTCLLQIIVAKDSSVMSEKDCWHVIRKDEGVPVLTDWSQLAQGSRSRFQTNMVAAQFKQPLIKVVPPLINNLCLLKVFVFCQWEVQLPEVPVSCPVPGMCRLHLLVRWRWVFGVLAGQQGLVPAVCLTVPGRLLGHQQLGRPGIERGGEAPSPAAVHCLLIGGQGDRKSIHHQVQLVWGAAAAGTQS